jgi:hypothetical protein
MNKARSMAYPGAHGRLVCPINALAFNLPVYAESAIYAGW